MTMNVTVGRTAVSLDGTIGVAALRAALHAWIDGHAQELAACAVDETLDVPESLERSRVMLRMLFDAGWTRLGWPVTAGGLGGDPLLRAVVYEELLAAGYVLPETLPSVEVVLPAMLEFAPELVADRLPDLLTGAEVCAQGFSEPEAGSDLAALRTRAVDADGHWHISGQKIWTSWGIVARRCLVLARTGTTEDRHRGISALLVDLDAPGVTVQPIRVMTGRQELAEIHFDDVVVPAARLVGEVGQGWAVAMYMLQYERGMFAWMRQAALLSKLSAVAARTAARPSLHRELGRAFLDATALRLIARRTVRALSAGENPGQQISVDKILLSTAEQSVLDVTRRVAIGEFELGADPTDRTAVIEYLHTRSASIYGGAVEVQRDLVAQRLLGLPRA